MCVGSKHTKENDDAITVIRCIKNPPVARAIGSDVELEKRFCFSEGEDRAIKFQHTKSSDL